jgi:internalin A
MSARALIVTGLCVTIGFLASPTLIDTASAPAAQPGPDTVVLHFPADQSLGTVTIVDAGPDQERIVARGDVQLPRGKRFRLDLSRAAADLSCLHDMPRLGLVALDCGNDKLLPEIVQIKGLESLSIGGSNIDDRTMASLAGMTSLSELVITAESVTEEGLYKLAPLRLKRLRLINMKLNDDCLLAIAKFEKLESLSLINVNGYGKQEIGDTGIAQLRDLTRLETLNLQGTRLTDVGLASLSGLENLKSLNISGTLVTNDGLKYLAGMRNLTTLEVDAQGVNDAGLTHIALRKRLQRLKLRVITSDTAFEQISKLAELRELEATIYNTSDAGWAHLEKLPALDSLLVSGLGVNDGAMKQIGRIPAIKKLAVSFATVTDEGMAHVANLENLERLSIYSAPITCDGLGSLAALKKLKWLSLGGITGLGREGLAVLADAPSLELINLSNGSNPVRTIPEDQLVHLARLPKLRFLQLSNIKTTDRGAKMLGQLPAIEELWLDRSCSHLTDAGLQDLARLERLARLGAGGTFTRRGLDALAQAKNLDYVILTTAGVTPPDAEDFRRVTAGRVALDLETPPR